MKLAEILLAVSQNSRLEVIDEDTGHTYIIEKENGCYVGAEPEKILEVMPKGVRYITTYYFTENSGDTPIDEAVISTMLQVNVTSKVD